MIYCVQTWEGVLYFYVVKLKYLLRKNLTSSFSCILILISSIVLFFSAFLSTTVKFPDESNFDKTLPTLLYRDAPIIPVADTDIYFRQSLTRRFWFWTGFLMFFFRTVTHTFFKKRKKHLSLVLNPTGKERTTGSFLFMR